MGHVGMKKERITGTVMKRGIRETLLEEYHFVVVKVE